MYCGDIDYSSFRKRARNLRILAIVGISLSILYLFVGVMAFVLSLLPLPLVGVVISVVMTAVEWVALGAACFINSLTLVKCVRLRKEFINRESEEQVTMLLRKVKASFVLSVIGCSILIVSGALVAFLSLIELFLMII